MEIRGNMILVSIRHRAAGVFCYGVDTMPVRPKRPCAYPGCPTLTNERHCIEHKREIARRYDEQRGSSSERGYTTTWAKVRKRYLNRHPLCERCEDKGLIVPAVLVHHIKRIVEGGALLDNDNLMSACRECHDELHKEHVFKR